ncbi:MAG: lysine--tRNA ligase [Candidatus Helarchaeota archaeon]|nr:lysine--tRNA ligase [Candidatus Helarchaeota archaeon]
MAQGDITFWADDLADAIIKRESYNYVDKSVPKLKKITIKSSTSISGVPHIGNACDIFRAEAVVKALRDKGQKVRFIWVAENMDPLRKVPAGIPDRFEAFLGRPVAELPCPEECCNNYSEHFVNLFIDSLRNHFGAQLEVFYMDQIYSSGQLVSYVRTALDKIERLREIINQYRASPLPEDWIPWKPICENCGKIITTRMKKREGNEVHYSCEDYKFKHRKIEGCHHQGVSDIREGKGKLLWRVEWASQWPLWKVPFEPYGKEHGVNCPHVTGTPRIGAGSFWVAGNITEEIFDWPEPCPTKAPNVLQPYEYVLVGGQKMSASLGNTIATWDWPTFAPPETLKLYFLRKPKSQSNIMTSQKINKQYKLIDIELDIPKLIDDLTDYSKLFYDFNAQKIIDRLKIDENKVAMYKRLYVLCQISEKIPPTIPKTLPTSTSLVLTPLKKVLGMENLVKKSIEVLQKIFISTPMTEKDRKKIELDLILMEKYFELYAPEKIQFEIKEEFSPNLKNQLTSIEKQALKIFLEKFQEEKWDEKSLAHEIYVIGRKILQNQKGLFRLLYQILLGKEFGPKLAPLLLAMDKNWIINRISDVFN